MIAVVRKIGSGTFEDPYRPNIMEISEIAKVNKRLQAYRQLGIEVRNITFYNVKIVEDLKTQFKIEVKDLIDLYKIQIEPPIVDSNPDTTNWGSEEAGIRWYHRTNNQLCLWTGVDIIYL